MLAEKWGEKISNKLVFYIVPTIDLLYWKAADFYNTKKYVSKNY